MSNSFSQRFGGHSRRESSKPECYGDPDYYEGDDPQCRACPVQSTCRVVSEKRARSHNERHNRPVTIREPRAIQRKSRAEASRAIEDYEEGDTWFSALVHNACIEGITAGAKTAVDALESIPKKRYPNPFAPRKKRDKI